MTTSRNIRVLVVDDSAFIRRVLRRILERHPDIEVVGEAKDGETSIDLARRLRPDVVTLDVEMRGIGGLEALRAMAAEPEDAPAVIMVSSLTTRGARATLEALELGAVDFIAKPRFDATPDEIVALGEEVLEKVRVFGNRRRDAAPTSQKSPQQAQAAPRCQIDCVAIGTSTGGPVALSRVLPMLPRDFPAAIVVAQHMPRGFTTALAERLNAISAIDVQEASDGAVVEPGRAFVAPAGNDTQLKCEAGGVRLDVSAAANVSLTPRVDVLFRSLARTFGERGAAVLLTGMGRDGVDGLRAVREAGGFSIGQDEATCVVFGMPRAAAEAGLIDRVVPLHEVPRLLCEVTGLGVPLQRQEGSRPLLPGT